MMKLLLLLLLVLMSLSCEAAEHKSRGWYLDRMLLRLSGFYVGCALGIALGLL